MTAIKTQGETTVPEPTAASTESTESYKELRARMKAADHDARLLRRQLKIANKVIGNQGVTIRHLRDELIRLRVEHSRIERGDLRSMDRAIEILTAELATERKTIRELLGQAGQRVSPHS